MIYYLYWTRMDMVSYIRIDNLKFYEKKSPALKNEALDSPKGVRITPGLSL